MRAGIGILSVLLALAIILMVEFSGPGGGAIPVTLKAGQTAQSQVNQMAGRDSNDVRAQDSIALEEDNPSGSKLRGLIVKNVLPAGPMEVVYGLKIGDEITGTGPVRVRDESDPEMAKAMVFDAYARNWPLVITRNGQELTLNPNSPLTNANPNLFAAPGATPGDGSKIQNIPTH